MHAVPEASWPASRRLWPSSLKRRQMSSNRQQQVDHVAATVELDARTTGRIGVHTLRQSLERARDRVVDIGRLSLKARAEISPPWKPPKLQPQLIRHIALANFYAHAVLANGRIDRLWSSDRLNAIPNRSRRPRSPRPTQGHHLTSPSRRSACVSVPPVGMPASLPTRSGSCAWRS